ncbi:TetR family transcriptional regulator [Cellulosimicrobium cellulans]|uniref:TetR/AcrR family transcriptional regulator n=1 Tax=Cellulosimicrobium cellulans TaxID=1710 RepID=UPI0019661D30|nr:TetR/AcrR family transcriptional regulator [Cellulosimicrobium cellulans]MBN0041717.1 TetR family transcriptional regulator [Cellulosimicrobium cellulans]
MTDVRSRTHAQAVDAAIELFTRKGYEQTTVEEIADAAQVSRATFFRRYGSKEDVVFADHELLLDEVVVMLAATRPVPDAEGHLTPDPTVDPYLEVCRAARLVFDHHVGQRETSLARWQLLQQVPALRDRELVTTHRYERAFTAYLRDALPPDERRSTASIAFAASVVAVHNALLRRWLRSPDQDLRPQLEEAFADLRRAAVGRYAAPDGTAPAERRDSGDGVPGRRVVVTVVDAGADAQGVADDVARAVRDALA